MAEVLEGKTVQVRGVPEDVLAQIKQVMLAEGETQVSHAHAMLWAAKRFVQMSKGRAAKTAR